ncbi:Exopolyphosphatase [Friedmanniomyces endolithicus]|nr:Exopolyphosphatase [Friedmanniomyces endolithicus]
MSRLSIRTFLVTAKRHLRQAISDKGTASFVIGNESADLDSITCAIVYGYIQSSSSQARRKNHVVIPVTNIAAADLGLRPELTALLRHAGVKPDDLITLDDLGNLPMPLSKTDWTLVDHNALTGCLAQHYASSVSGVIDHHDDEAAVPSSATPRIIEKSGSCNSLIVNQLRSTWDDVSSNSTSVGAANAQSSDGVIDDEAYTTTWDAQVAKLALGSILIDTHCMTDESKVTEHDRRAVRYLEARINASHKYGKDYDRKVFFEEINAAKSDLDALSLVDVLRKDYKQWTEGVKTVGISSVVKPISWLRKKAEGDFTQTLIDFANKRELQLLAIMTAFTSESGDFARELLLIALDGEGATEAAERFVKQAASELKLEQSELESVSGRSGPPFMQLWHQKNVAASRKKGTKEQYFRSAEQPLQPLSLTIMSNTPGGQGGYQQSNQQWAYNDGRTSVQYHHQETTFAQSAVSTPAPIPSPYQILPPVAMPQMLPAPNMFQQHQNIHNMAMQQAAQIHASATQGMFQSMQPALPAPMSPFPQQAHMLPPAQGLYPQAQIGYAPATPMPQVESPDLPRAQMAAPYSSIQQRGTPQAQRAAAQTPGFVEEGEASSGDEESSEDDEEVRQLSNQKEQRGVSEQRGRAAHDESAQAAQRAMQEQLRRIEDQNASERKEREVQNTRELKDREARDAQAAKDRQDWEAKDTRDRQTREARDREERNKKDLEVASLQSRLNAEREQKDRDLAMVQSTLNAEREKKDVELAMMQSKLDAERQEKLDQERKYNHQLAAFAGKASSPQPQPTYTIDLSPLQTVLAELSASRLQTSDIAALVENTMARQLQGVARNEDLASSTSKVQKALNKLPANASAADVQNAVEKGIADVMKKASKSRGRGQQAAIEAGPVSQPGPGQQRAGPSRLQVEFTIEDITDDQPHNSTPEASQRRAGPASEYPTYAQSATPVMSSSNSRALPPPEYPAYPQPAAPLASSSRSQASADRALVYGGNNNELTRAQPTGAPSRDSLPLAEHAMSLYESSESGSLGGKTRSSARSNDGNALAKVKRRSAAPSVAPAPLTENALARFSPTEAGPSISGVPNTRSPARPRDHEAMSQAGGVGMDPPPYTEMADSSQLSLRGGTRQVSTGPELPDDFPDNASMITTYERARDTRAATSRSGMTNDRAVDTLKQKNDQQGNTALVKGSKKESKKFWKR